MVVALFVCYQQPACKVDNAGKIVDVANWRPGRNPTQETDFRLVDVAGTRQIPLVEQRLTDSAAGIDLQASDCLVGIPIGPEQVGAEVSDERGFGGRRYQRDVVNTPAHRRPACVG